MVKITKKELKEKELNYFKDNLDDTLRAWIEVIQAEIKKSKKLLNLYNKNPEKTELIYKQISKLNYIKNFSIHILYNNFNKEFLNEMFDNYDLRLDYRKFNIQMGSIIRRIKMECIR